MIRLRDIRFRYNSRYVLDGLQLWIDPGDRIGLVGATGSGKTTLCQIVMGLLTPESGDVEVFGKLRKRESDFAEIRGRVGFLFQDSDDQLFCPTVLEDVAFGPLNMGKNPREAAALVDSTLGMLGLEGFANRVTYNLSGGEKRLVALATVLAMEPAVIILDEPTTGLDEKTTDRLVKALVDSQLTYLVISHDREFVNRTTHTLMQIKDGQINRIS